MYGPTHTAGHSPLYATQDTIERQTMPVAQQPWTPANEYPAYYSHQSPYAGGGVDYRAGGLQGHLVSPPIQPGESWLPPQPPVPFGATHAYPVQGLGPTAWPQGAVQPPYQEHRRLVHSSSGQSYHAHAAIAHPYHGHPTPEHRSPQQSLSPYQSYFPPHATGVYERQPVHAPGCATWPYNEAANPWALSDPQLVTPPDELCDMAPSALISPQPTQNCSPQRPKHTRTASEQWLQSPRLKRQSQGIDYPLSNDAGRPCSPALTLNDYMPYLQNPGPASSSSSATDVSQRDAILQATPDTSAEPSPGIAQKQTESLTSPLLLSPPPTQPIKVQSPERAVQQQQRPPPKLKRIVQRPPAPLPPPVPGGRPVNRVGMTMGAWTKQDDRELIAAIEAHAEEDPLPWSVIGRSLACPRSGQQCQSHWSEALDPTILRGRWTTELDQQLMSLTAVYENKWARISEHLPGKTQRQCRSRWVALQCRYEKARTH